MSSCHEDGAPTPKVEVRDFIGTEDPVNFIRDQNDYAAAASDPTPRKEIPMTAGDTIILRTHDGDNYVLPYLPWEITKSHVVDIYRLRDRATLADAVNEGKSSLMDNESNIILPSLWSQVVKPGATVQVVLPLEILNPDIEVHYRYDDYVPTSRHRSRKSSDASSLDSARDRSRRRVRVEREDDFDGRRDSEDYSDASSGSIDDLDLESISSGSEVSESSAPPVSLTPTVRPAIVPKDEDGNDLVFKAHTTFNGLLDRDTPDANSTPNKGKPQQPTAHAESISIAKAVSSETDNRTSLQLFQLKGPRTSSTSLDEDMRWFHLRSSPMDLSGFRNTCLSIPGLSQRLQSLVRKTFDKVEKEKVKVSLDGMFIEPGTVLRADENNQSDPGSVIFSCVTFFDLQIPTKKRSNTGQVNRFPSRTLMQSYYPYEPVQDRDAEQAYRIFGNEQRDALVHVPSLWMMNIGPNIVATCGHQALQDGFVQSIKLVSMDQKDIVGRRNIRLTDWEHRRLLFHLDECQSYFEMEQKLKELRWCSSYSRSHSREDDKNLQLSWKTTGGQVRVTPASWTGILRQRDNLFIELSLPDGVDTDHELDDATHLKTSTALTPVPFFQWPQKPGTEVAEKVLLSDAVKRSIRCLDIVEKAITSEVLRSDDSYSAVEKTFISTQYYRNLTQSTVGGIKVEIQNLRVRQKQLAKPRGDDCTSHRAIVFRQQKVVAQKASELSEVMESTLSLFVADVDKSTMLRKAWAAMRNICDLAAAILERKLDDSDFDTLVSKTGADPPANSDVWCVIRPEIGDEVSSEPLQKLKRSFERCRTCRRAETYKTASAALLHAEKHFKHVGGLNASTLSAHDCVIKQSQMMLEVMNKGAVDMLTKACEKAQQLLGLAEQLSHGVLGKDGQMSDLYTLPPSLLGGFRQLLIFYFAVERALYYGEESFQKATAASERSDWRLLANFSSSVDAIETFAGGVQRALTAARSELCSMVKSSGPVEIFKRLSLSPEYVCSWFMRRLIVKPLERSMTVSDMYREYLSTIQFQVNHRPSKRLLRSINLLQEEIAALQEVNTQQSKLISNYMSVLDDATYEKDKPYRRAMFPYEHMLLESCLDSLKMSDQEYRYLLARCGPLSDSTKQSLEINEEDHGKAILVFTVVTVIFLPLSFVTSFLGMNTTDIRDMGSTSTLFWAIAIPLTTVTMGSVMYIGYNGDDLRDFFGSFYRKVTGKQDRSIGARGISVAQRKMARKSADLGSALDFSSLADEAEFANPRPDEYQRNRYRSDYARPSQVQYSLDPPALQWEPYTRVTKPIVIPEPRAKLRTQTFNDEWYAPKPVVSEFPIRGKATGRTSEYLVPEEDYATWRPSAPVYERTRVDKRPEARTYAEPISLDIPPTPSSYVQRNRQNMGFYTTRRTGRGSEQYSTAPPHYEWTKQRHGHHRSTRDRPRRGSRSRRDDTD